jgi:hypothetical protein
MRKALVLLMLLAAILVSGQNANAATIWVSPNALGPAPGISCNNAGYATIQGAINAANSGDTVNVCPGTYVENITINKANLMVSSTGGTWHQFANPTFHSLASSCRLQRSPPSPRAAACRSDDRWRRTRERRIAIAQLPRRHTVSISRRAEVNTRDWCLNSARGCGPRHDDMQHLSRH